MPRLPEVACRRRAVVVCAWEGNSTSHLGQHGMRRRGGRWLPAACGALAGRAAATWAEAQLGRMRMLSTRAVSWAVANHRVLGEAAGAAAGAVLFRGATLRALRGGLFGALAGHGVARVACAGGGG